MSALLVYAFLKGRREQLLTALFLAPAVMVVAPLLVIGLIDLLQGRPAYPISLAPRMSPREAASMLDTVVVMFATVIAGVGAFEIFRAEATARTIGFFFLARRAPEVVGAATIFGMTAGIGAYAIALASIAVVCGTFPSLSTSRLVLLPVSVFATATVGVAALAVSSERGMLLPVLGGAGVIAAYLLSAEQPAFVAAAVAATAISSAATSVLWRRRCAA